MLINSTVLRLRECVTGLREVDSAAGLDAAMQSSRVVPAAYVIPLNESASDASKLGLHQHWETHLFGVIYVISARNASGSVVDELNALRTQAKAGLIGWVPDTQTGEPVKFVGGELVQFAGDGRLWWSDEFTHTTLYRGQT